MAIILTCIFLSTKATQQANSIYQGLESGVCPLLQFYLPSAHKLRVKLKCKSQLIPNMYSHVK